MCALSSVCQGIQKSDPGLNHQTTVKIILSNKWTKEFFSIMEVIKEFVVKGYVDAIFDTNPNNSE